jgi:pyruvate/2-oxoglutarate dehydrogenase complex dihydrolipoamide dehydrogenase (E3) component
MSTPEQYDAIIIGSGEAGKYLAWHFGSQGKKVANIEDKRLGGACPNIACLPCLRVTECRRPVRQDKTPTEDKSRIPNSRPPKINLKTVASFSTPKKQLLKHHISHTKHHTTHHDLPPQITAKSPLTPGKAQFSHPDI